MVKVLSAIWQLLRHILFRESCYNRIVLFNIAGADLSALCAELRYSMRNPVNIEIQIDPKCHDPVILMLGICETPTS